MHAAVCSTVCTALLLGSLGALGCRLACAVALAVAVGRGGVVLAACRRQTGGAVG